MIQKKTGRTNGDRPTTSTPPTKRRRADDTVPTSEATYRAIFNADNEGMVVLDAETGEIVDVNAAFCNLLGYPPDETRGLRLEDLSSGEAPYTSEDALRWIRKAASGQPQRFEWLMKDRSGSLFWVDVTLGRANIAGEDRVIAAGRDITGRRQAEEALRRSEAAYREIFNATNDGIVVLDVETGEIVDANATFLNVLGYTREEAQGLRVGDFSSGTAAYTQEDALRLIREAASREPQRFEWLAKGGHGRHLWIDVTLKRATIAGHDRVLAIGRDITERKRAEEALRGSEERFRAIVENAPFGYYRVGKDGLWQYVNPVWERMHGYSLKDVIGKPFEITQTRDDLENARQVVRQALAGETITGEFSRTTRQGATEYHSFSTQPVRQGNEIVAIEGFIDDITERRRAEEALRETSQTLQALIRASPLAILTMDLQGNVRTWNSAAERIFGWSEQEAVGRPNPIIPEDRQDEFRALLDAVLQGNLLSQVETRRRKKDGSLIDVSLSTAAMRNATGGVVAAMAILADITGRKQAEEALRESEQRFRLLAENVTDVIWTADMDLNYTYISPSRRLLGQAPRRPMPQKVEEALTPASFEIARKALAEELAIESMENKDLSRSRTLELENYRSDGSTVWVEDRMTFLRDPDGRPVGILGVTRDITERKRAEEALRDSEQRFRTVSEESFEGIAIHRKGTMLEANQALAAMFGYELSAAIKMHVLDFVAPESRDAVLQSIVSKSREPFEFTGLRKDRTTFPVEVCGRPIPYQGKMVTVAALRDITERKRVEEALQKAREELEARVERQMERGNPYGLTFRELTVLHVVAAGKADKEIGSQLGITTLTASKHLGNILNKMGAASRTEAGVRALREGLLD